MGSPISRWQELNEQTGHSRYPVVDQTLKVRGMVAAKDVFDQPKELVIEKVMTSSPITVNERTSIAAVAHMMVWQGIELLPVTDSQRKLIGVVSRQDVLKAMQTTQRQPHVGETIEEIVTSRMEEVENQQEIEFTVDITPQMTDQMGTISYGVVVTLMVEAAKRMMRKHKRGDIVLENLTLYFLKPVQIESQIKVLPQILEIGRKHGKFDVELYREGERVGKGLLTAQLIE